MRRSDVTGSRDATDGAGAPSDSGRFARWLAGWRVAIRIARRDARRYKGRSALIVAMVGLPVLLLTGGITLMSTQDVSLAESAPSLMGSAQARIYSGGQGRPAQSPDSLSTAGSDGGPGALAVPGFAVDSAWTTSKVARLTSGRVISTVVSYLRVTLGDRRPSMPVLGIDARDPLARGMTELVSGRWASTASEVVVTEAGVARGLPQGGTLSAPGRDGKPRLLTVVGVATAHTGQELPWLVALPGLDTGDSDPARGSAAFLLERGDPVTWSDVRRMNSYGLLVQSREVFQNPPPADELDPRVTQTVVSDQRQFDLVLLLAAVGLFIETTLLAGPAFAVSAARQRRSLALAASNGAEARQLRRYVLGQAIVLGVMSAAAATVAGVLLMLAGLSWWKAGHATFEIGPFDVSWPRVLGVFLCAVVASVGAALLPAKGIARLDILAVLAGRSGDRPARRGLPALGVVVMVLSGIGLIWSVASGGESGSGLQLTFIVVGAVGLVVGCLMVIPALLALIGRLSTHLALPLRLAARDTARQRGRSTPAVAAIMAAVAGLTALSIGAASDQRKQENAYELSRPMGTGVIVLNGEDSSERSVRAVLARFAPQLMVESRGYVSDTAAAGVGSREVSWVSPLPPGCTEAQILAVRTPEDGVRGCAPLANGAPMLFVGGLSSLSARITLSTSQQAMLKDGGILTTNPKLVQDGQVSYVAGTERQVQVGVSVKHAITQRTRAPAVLVDPRNWPASYLEQASTSTWVLASTATRLGWPVRNTSFDLSAPTGAISPEVERAVADRLGDGYIMDVERGFQNSSRLLLLIAFSVTGLLVLIASLISTALSLAESQNDMATLAAVGATRHTRRSIAASQALVVAACGCLLGVAVGIIPGIAVTWPLTTRMMDQLTGQEIMQAPTTVIPWLHLLAVCLVVPLLAAGLAWVAVRRHPRMTRRLA
jgi:putative ABC transport system permease protein